MIREPISTAEIRDMLTLRKTELERSLSEQATRLRHIESRLQQIDELGSLRDYDVVLKSAPRQPYVSVRQTYAGMEHVVAMLREVARAASARLSERIRGPMVVVAYSDFEEEDLDLEIGFSLKDEPKRSVTLPGRLEMVAGELPAVEHLATVVRSGPIY